MKTRASYTPRAYSYRLPLYLALGGILLAAIWEVACPRRTDAQAAPERYTFVTGPMNQTETEREECYATIGFNPKLGFMVAAPPDAVVCARLRELAARKAVGRLVFEVER